MSEILQLFRYNRLVKICFPQFSQKQLLQFLLNSVYQYKIKWPLLSGFHPYWNSLTGLKCQILKMTSTKISLIFIIKNNLCPLHYTISSNVK